MEVQQVDVIVIGAGQGGAPLAEAYAREGKQVVLFERDHVGGTCVNYGCLPSKAFLASAHAAADARNADRLGVHADVSVDFPRVMARARETTRSSRQSVRDRLVDAGVQVVEATAAFLNSNTVHGGIQVQAPVTVINTGKSPAIPPIPGLDAIDFLTYESFWTLDQLPARTLVLGGGYVGVELGQGIARLGSVTHIVERGPRIVGTEEEDVSRTLTEALEADGIQIHLNTEVTGFSERDGVIHAALSDGRTLDVDALLVATGRQPNVDDLDLPMAGIETGERGHILVNQHFATSNPLVYAIGDVTGQPAFTHVAWEDYRRLRAILAGDGRHRGDRVLAYVFFTEPQVGRVGLTAAQARERGHEIREATIPLTHVARAGLTGHKRGFYRMVVDAQDDKILGATLVGPQAGEVAQILLAHMEAGSTWQVVERTTHVHPSYAEGLPTLARQFC